jgi:hypothetical protein
MLLRSMRVQNFRLVQDADLTFGAGLNVLYGSNDTGKSTLAEALRAALLLPVSSNEAREFIPWGTDFVPQVVAVFEIQGCAWRITKRFAVGARGTAVLHQLQPGGAPLEDSRGRAADSRLRELLAWGIPAPGGKGAPRGFPESYLTTALLGRQESVTAILDATLAEDREESGRQVITAALGALAQDPLVARVVQRLTERVGAIFTATGQLSRAADSPLVELTCKIEDHRQRLQSLEAQVRRSQEIEQKVQALLDQRTSLTETCSQLRRRLDLLRRRAQAQADVAAFRDYEARVKEAEVGREQAEKCLRTAEGQQEEASSAFTNAENDRLGAQERFTRAGTRREMVRQTAQTTREARLQQLTRMRENADQRAQAARTVLDAHAEFESREHVFHLADSSYQRAQQDEAQDRLLLEFARAEGEWNRASAACDALATATKEHADRAAQAKKAKEEFEKAGKQLTDAERSHSLLLALFQAETEEREAILRIAALKDAVTSAKRLRDLERRSADLEKARADADVLLEQNAAQRQECETRRFAVSAPVWPSLVGGVVGALLSGALASFIGAQGLLLGAVALGVGLFVGGLAAAAVWLRRRRAVAGSRQQECDRIAKARQQLLEERLRLLTECGSCGYHVEAARNEHRRLVDSLGEDDLPAAERQAELRRKRWRGESAELRKQLADLTGCPRPDSATTLAHVKQAEQALAPLKQRAEELQRSLDAARRRVTEAQIRLEAASSAAAPFDLTTLRRQLDDARRVAGNPPASTLAEAEGRLEKVREDLGEQRTARKVAEGRLSDARAAFEKLAAALGQPPGQVLAEAEQQWYEADLALGSVDQSLLAEVTAAEKDCESVQEEVTRLGQQSATLRGLAEAAQQACDLARSRRHEADRNLAMLLQNAPTVKQDKAETELADAQGELETDAAIAASFPDDVAVVEDLLHQRQEALQRITDELHAARGQLELVGGLVAREERDQEQEALETLRKSADDLELEYKATKLLLDILEQEEAAHAGHLGKSLSLPVTERLKELTGNRYAQVLMDPGLRLLNVTAEGGERELSSLSVGTRDQLATLVRLALAAHLKSILLLDDQLTHADPDRLGWFRDLIRASVLKREHQVIVITCRPLDYLSPTEIQSPPDGGSPVVQDLGRVVSLFSRRQPTDGMPVAEPLFQSQ